MSVIVCSFAGWIQIRLATNPDPPDEPRGISGYTFALPGEPALDRLLRTSDPVAPRSHGPLIGVAVRAVTVDGVAHDIFLGDMNCSLANIDSCLECTKNDNCDDTCQPENCEVCFGETEPPPGCDMPTCDGSDPCKIDNMGNSNCPADQFCSTGCCVPIVPG